MATSASVQTCRWGTPTLFLQWPWWYEASHDDWSCTRGGISRVLHDPSICRNCPYWTPAERPVTIANAE